MTVQGRRIARLIVSAITSGLMGAGTVVLGAVTGEGTVKPGTWLIAGVSGIMFVCKDLQASLSKPPRSTNERG